MVGCVCRRTMRILGAQPCRKTLPPTAAGGRYERMMVIWIGYIVSQVALEMAGQVPRFRTAQSAHCAHAHRLIGGGAQADWGRRPG